MKEIKFRAWDRYSKRMGHFEAGFQWLDEYNLWHLQQIAEEHKNSITEVPCEDNIALMQFTGLRDKNGKEIYEGDLVEFRPHRTGEIKWQPQGACFYISYNVGAKGFYCDISSLAMYGDDKQIILTDVEVIGNIYENTELLLATKP